MSYCIKYDPEKKKIYPQKATGKPRWLILALVLVVLLFAAQKLDTSGKIKSILLPGDPQTTSAALSTMITEIREGEPVGEAVTAFCLEIIHNE